MGVNFANKIICCFLCAFFGPLIFLDRLALRVEAVLSEPPFYSNMYSPGNVMDSVFAEAIKELRVRYLGSTWSVHMPALLVKNIHLTK